MLSAADHKRLVKMRELQHAQMRKKERAKVRGATSTEPTIPRTRAKLSAPAPAANDTPEHWAAMRAAGVDYFTSNLPAELEGVPERCRA